MRIIRKPEQAIGIYVFFKKRTKGNTLTNTGMSPWGSMVDSEHFCEKTYAYVLYHDIVAIVLIKLAYAEEWICCRRAPSSTRPG